MMKAFDLNMEDVLENWEVYHAIREIIANALDEQLISDTKEISIEPSNDLDGWVIRDYGRGIKIEHFTQNENPEKFSGPPGTIGKFGVGLKDALATFYRNNIDVTIKSRFGTYTVAMHTKEGFDEIETLHVMYDDRPIDMHGTIFILKGATEEQINQAKELFLKFSEIEVLESTKYGDILESSWYIHHDEDIPNRVYINGVLASEEPNFLFSYNITNLTKTMRKALNRERTNVGRTTYTERVKSILKSAKSDEVLERLATEVRNRSYGFQSDEIMWTEIAQLGINALAKLDDRVIFATEKQALNNPDELERMRSEGYTVIVSSERDHDRIDHDVVNTFTSYVEDWNESFEYEFVDEQDLTANEKKIFAKTNDILQLVVSDDEDMPRVRISETIQNERDFSNGALTLVMAVGVYDPEHGIVIHRMQLDCMEAYAGTLLHEAAHATSGAGDATRAFETELTNFLGIIAKIAVDPI